MYCLESESRDWIFKLEGIWKLLQGCAGSIWHIYYTNKIPPFSFLALPFSLNTFLSLLLWLFKYDTECIQSLTSPFSFFDFMLYTSSIRQMQFPCKLLNERKDVMSYKPYKILYIRWNDNTNFFPFMMEKTSGW